MIKYKISLILLLVTFLGFSQTNGFVPKFWGLTALSGNVRTMGSYSVGSYGNEDNALNLSSNRIEVSQATVGLSLFTKSYIYHPNLLSLDISGSYDPSVSKHQDLVQPDYASNSTSKFLRVRSQILKRSKFNVAPFYNYSENYVNRENFTNVKSVFKSYGATLNYNNKYFPLLINYNNNVTNHLEIESNRSIIRDETVIDAETSKEYGKDNDADLSFTRTIYKSGIDHKNNIESTTNNIDFNNNIKFNTKRETELRTNVNYYGIEQSNNVSKRFSVNNGLLVKLPNNFMFRTNHRFNQIENNNQVQKNNNVLGILSHKWYQSLTSNLSFEFEDEKQQLYKETRYEYNLQLNYAKKLPFSSNINIAYSYTKSNRDRAGDSFVLDIFNEAVVVSDSEIVLIDNEGVNVLSIVVKDVSNTIIYQENLDYFLIKNGNFVEIKRIPGGLIENNTTVLIDYNALQPNSYKLKSNSNSFGASLSIYKSLFEFYYNFSKKSYENAVAIDNLTLDYFKRYKYGSKFNVRFLSAGIEYDNYESDIVPYKMLNYFVTMNARLKDKLFFQGNWNAINYLSLGLDEREQQLTYFSGNISYRFNYKTNLNITVGYNEQKTEELELNWLNGRLEFLTRIHSLEMGINLNITQKKYLNQNSDFLGGGIRLSRKF
ncbi:MAG: hypothetical protein RQ875_13080 [Vicingaceae bacterium]|nr:hypothetical protein [Vicingaceae bacterium]